MPPQSPVETAIPASKPRFELDFDPYAKESVPLDFPGQEVPAEEAEPLPAEPFSAEPLPPAAILPSSSSDNTFSPGQLPEVLMPAARQAPADKASMPKLLHFRCPSGHIVKAGSSVLGQNGRCPACKKTFELRYEDSFEFKRRAEKLLRQKEVKSGKAWVVTAFAVAFLIFVLLIALLVRYG